MSTFKFSFSSLLLLTSLSVCLGQHTDDTDSTFAIYSGGERYEVGQIISPAIDKEQRVKNIILMIGDGMGTAQVYAGLTANRGQLFLQNCPVAGFSKTYSSDKYITDSAAGATAFSAGKKTYNGAIGVDSLKRPLKTILEVAEEKGLATGLVATCRITHATPASFIAHQPSRNMYEEIAADFLNTDIDVFIGGGKKDFESEVNGKSILDHLETKGYTVLEDTAGLADVNTDKLAALVAEMHLPPMSAGRGSFLTTATSKALDILSKDKDGFFLMVEGSQIDWGGHDNNTSYIVQEMLDFDRAIGEALRFAAEDGETLVIITADHETGGFTLNGGDISTGKVEGKFTTGSHTGVMVPVFAFGPQAIRFGGIMENTSIYHKMMEAYTFEKKQH